jgi:hypothetical protein
MKSSGATFTPAMISIKLPTTSMLCIEVAGRFLSKRLGPRSTQMPKPIES